MLHRAICKGDLNQIDKLESLCGDEYYCTVNAFLKEIKKAEQQQEKRVKS